MIIAILLILNLVCFGLLTWGMETFSVMYTPPPPPPKYTYDDMLTIETLREKTTSNVSYIAVDDQNYKVFAILSKATNNLASVNVATQLATSLGIDDKMRIFYGKLTDLKTILSSTPSIDLVPYLAGKAANVVYALYPYAHIKTFSLQMLAPQRYPKQDAFIDLITIPMAWVEGLNTNGIKKTLGQYQQDVQQFYAMFVPYKSYPSPPRLSQLSELSERYTNQSINLKLSKPLESVKVLKMIRDVNVRISVHALEVSSLLGNLKLEQGDQLVLQNQKHRSVEGIYYVIARNKNVLVLESTKQQDSIDVRPGDRIFNPTLQLAGVVDTDGKPIYLNDVTARAQKETCISNPNLKTRTVCESKFDLFGKPKKELDVWDRPCEYDNDCPFFNVSSYRGGCIAGVCEMPLGAKQVGFRKYVVENPAHLDLWTLSPFQAVVSSTTETYVDASTAPFEPANRQYVYFPNQPNAPIRDDELLTYLNKVVGHSVGTDELQTLLEVSGLAELNYYIPVHRKLTPNRIQCVIIRYQAVEGHTIELEVANKVYKNVKIIGRVHEQSLHQP